MPNNGDFRKAFADAKKKEQKTFTYKGKRYTTQTAAEKAKTQSRSQNLKSANRAYEKAKSKGFKSKSHNEILDSYANEYHKQTQKKYGSYSKKRK